MTGDHTQNRGQLLEAYLAHTKALEQGVEDDRYFWAVEAMWKLVERDREGSPRRK